MDDSSDDDTFVVIGTPLTPYAEGEALKKPLAVQELEVKDKKGRARFHGAFTGGFSAGYFNTVGSKEGFTPSAFVSSKNKEKDVTISQEQKPEDFMDEEDFGEHGIAPRVVSATAEFGVKDGKRKIKETLEEAVLNDLIVPARTSMGFKLLRDLGWKDGQGIGARRKRMSKKKNEKGVKVYGCALPQSDSDESDGEFVPDHVTFAPKDVNPVKFQPKDNVHGLGYSGIKPGAFSANSHFSLFSERDPTRNVGKTKGIGAAGQAFGVGDFEDEDDVDVYATDDRNKYDKVLGGQGHQKNYGWTAPKHQGLSSAPLGYLGQVLEGFKLSKSTLKPKKTFPPPQLPKDFKPFHRREVSSQKKDNENTLDKKQTKHIDANVRQGMLGELKSVFHLLSESDKAKMQAAKTNTEKVLSNASEGRTNSRFTDECTSEQSVEKATTTKSTLCGGSTNFKPFACDPEKQKRYEQYLEATKNGKKELTEIPVGSMTEWERSKETEEFGRAARLYRPLAGMMASRFTKAKYQDNEDVVEVPADETANKSDQKKAVEMKMFGRLTRERFEWHPDRVLCKRFNVANPYPGNTMVGVPKVKRDKYSVFNFLNHPGEVEDQVVEEKQEDEMETEAADVNLKPLAILAQEDMSLQSTAQVKSLTSEIDQATLSSSTEDTGTRQLDEAVVVSERPAMDIFKAIFSDSSEEDGSSEEEADKTESDEPTESKTTPASRVLSSIFGRDSVIDKANNTKTSSASPPNSQQGSITVQSLSERLAPSDPMPHDTDPLTSQTVDCQCSNTQGTKNMSSQDLTSSASEAIDLCGPALPPGFSIGETQPHQVHPPGGGSSNRDRAGEEDRELWVVGADGQSHKTGNIDSSKVEKKKHKKHSVKKKKSKQHKKHKHKSSSDKKKKKHKKQKKKKEVVVISSTSSSSSDSEGSLSDQIIIDRLKNLPKGKRPTAVDFM